jgi:hypothetical protein
MRLSSGRGPLMTCTMAPLEMLTATRLLSPVSKIPRTGEFIRKRLPVSMRRSSHPFGPALCRGLCAYAVALVRGLGSSDTAFLSRERKWGFPNRRVGFRPTITTASHIRTAPLIAGKKKAEVWQTRRSRSIGYSMLTAEVNRLKLGLCPKEFFARCLRWTLYRGFMSVHVRPQAFVPWPVAHQGVPLRSSATRSVVPGLSAFSLLVAGGPRRAEARPHDILG